MITFLKDWILNLAAVAIILVLVEILTPAGKNKKFINLISGFILILTIIQPFFKFLNKDINFNEIYAQSNIYSETIFGEGGSAGINMDSTGRLNAEKIKEKQTAEITNIYRKKVIDEIQRLVVGVDKFEEVKSDVIINEDSNSYNYGEIKKVYVTVYLHKRMSKGKDEHEKLDININNIKQIDEIKVNPTEYEKSNNGENNTYSDSDSNNESDSDGKNAKLIKKLEEKISLAFRLEKENIIILIK